MFQAGAIPQMDIAVRATGDPELLRDAIGAPCTIWIPAPPNGIVPAEQRLAHTLTLSVSDDSASRIGWGMALTLAVVGAVRHRPSLVAARRREIGIHDSTRARMRQPSRAWCLPPDCGWW